MIAGLSLKRDPFSGSELKVGHTREAEVNGPCPAQQREMSAQATQNPMLGPGAPRARVTKQLTQAPELMTGDPEVRLQLVLWGVDNDGADAGRVKCASPRCRMHERAHVLMAGAIARPPL